VRNAYLRAVQGEHYAGRVGFSVTLSIAELNTDMVWKEERGRKRRNKPAEKGEGDDSFDSRVSHVFLRENYHPKSHHSWEEFERWRSLQPRCYRTKYT